MKHADALILLTEWAEFANLDWKKVKKLEVNMMNGELDRFKSTPAGATDPDSIWRGQMMQADKALLEAGLPALNVRKF